MTRAMSLPNFLRFATLLTVALMSCRSWSQDDSVKARTKQHFAAGLAHIDDPAGPRYEDAYREFHAAYAETPALSIAGNIGTCALYLERDAEAIEMYELFLSKAKPSDISKKKREQMQKDVQALRAGLVRISVRTKPDAGVLVDQRFTASGTIVVNRYPVVQGVASLGIHPGNHKIAFEADGHEPQSWAFDASPASQHEHAFALESVARVKHSTGHEPTSAPREASKEQGINLNNRKHTSALVYVGTAATGALALGAVGLGLVARSKNAEYEGVNDGAHTEQASDLRSDTKKLLLAADVLAGVAVISAGVTLYVYLSGDTKGKASMAAANPWRVSPLLGPERLGLAFKGKF